MENKKNVASRLLAVVLIISILGLIVLGFFVYKLNTSNTNIESKNGELEKEITTLNKKLGDLEEELDPYKYLEGSFSLYRETLEDVGSLEFTKEGKVKVKGRSTKYGTYTINKNKVIVKLTDKEIFTDKFELEKLDEEKIYEFEIKDEDTLLYIDNKKDVSQAFIFYKYYLPTLDLLKGKWVINDGSTEEYIIFNDDYTYECSFKDYNNFLDFNSKGTFAIPDNSYGVDLTDENGNIKSIGFQCGRFVTSPFLNPYTGPYSNPYYSVFIKEAE